MTGEKLSFVFQISQPPNTSQKWFSTQNVPFDVMFEVRQTPIVWTFYLWINFEKSLGIFFLKCLIF